MEITNTELLQRIEDLEAQMQQVRDGSIVEHISNAIHWKDVPKVLTGGTDYTTDGNWTDLSLKAWTSNKAKYVMLILCHTTNATAADGLTIRKNGTTPAKVPTVYCQVSGKAIRGFIIAAMDASQNVEYYATDASDTEIAIVGYIE